jgi:hypothetical protein
LNIMTWNLQPYSYATTTISGGRVRTFVLCCHVSPRLTVQVILHPLSTSSLGRRICASVRWRLILLERDRLRLQHGAIFFSWTFPHKPLDAAAFERCIQFCLVKAGIQATSGSTRSVAASVALASSASLDDVLRLGDWSNASTYFRFYHALLGIL